MAETPVRIITEERRGDVPLFVHPEWARTFPWLVQGTTGREAGNFSSFGTQTAQTVFEQWRRLRAWTGFELSVIGRQVHGARVVEYGGGTAAAREAAFARDAAAARDAARSESACAGGHLLADDSDGQITRAAGVLLAVSVADCVPVFVVDATTRAVAVLHAGWRGTAAGILPHCIDRMGADVHVFFGPAICGGCYEVGPEVHAQLGLPVPQRNTPVDLRAVLAAQCIAAGVPVGHMTTSSFCTRCGEAPFFSHRAGHAERQVGLIGVRPVGVRPD